jgi:methionine biosynthesis protein MetW
VSAATSIIYRHPAVYQALMRVLYGRGFDERYSAIAELIEPGSEVFEVCAGDAYLYEHHLARRGVRYRGGDLSEVFVRHAQRRGITLERLDVARDPIPVADYVVMQASLYQFIPEHGRVIAALLGAARQQLILAEPVENLSTSSSALVRWLARRSANPGDGHKAERFDATSLDAALRGSFGEHVEFSRPIARGREMLYCLRGQAPLSTSR